MKPFIGEVLPALLAMMTMGLAGILLVILFETLRSHWRLAFASANTTPQVEQPLTEAEPSDWDAENEPAEETQVPELRFDGDVDMFGGDFADPINTPPLLQEAPYDPVPEQDCIAPIASRIEQDNEPAIQAEPVLHDRPEQPEPAQARRNRDGKQRQGEAKSERRSRKAENARSEVSAEEPRRQAREDRDAAASEARALRRQSRRGNTA